MDMWRDIAKKELVNMVYVSLADQVSIVNMVYVSLADQVSIPTANLSQLQSHLLEEQ